MLTKTSSKKSAIRWERAKTVTIPIAKTGTKFKQFPESPPRPCEVTARFRYVPSRRNGAKEWHWRVESDTPLYKFAEADCDERRPVASRDKAIEAALAEILKELRKEVQIWVSSSQPEITSACAQALFQVEQFAKHFQQTGKFLTKAEKVESPESRVEEQTADSDQRSAFVGEIPASFKDIGHAVRKSFERKAAALLRRQQQGDATLEPSDVELLGKVPNETLSRRELEQATLLFERHGRRTKPKAPRPKTSARADSLDRQLNDFVERRTGQRPLPEPPPAVDQAGAAAAPETEIPLDAIVDSPYQLRQTHNEDLDGLKDTLLSHGLLQAIVVRRLKLIDTGGIEQFELLAGHRRCEAARLAGWTTIRAQVLSVDDATAEEIVVIENLLRKDLSAIEEAKGFQAMLARPGATQTDLAARLGVSQGHVANRVRLLRLPAVFQAAIMSGEITASRGRELVAVADIPSVIQAILVEANKKWNTSRSLGEVLDDSNDISGFIQLGTRSLTEGCGYNSEIGKYMPPFKPTAEQRAELDVRKFPRYEGSKETEERACNVALFDRLQAEHEKTFIAAYKKRADKKADGNSQPRKLTAAEQKGAAEEHKRREEKVRGQLKRRRKSLIIQRLKHLIAARIMDARTTESELLELALLAATRGWAEFHESTYRPSPLRTIAAKTKDAPLRQRAATILAECFWNSKENAAAANVWENSGHVEKVARLLHVDSEAAWKADQLGTLTKAYWNAHGKSDLVSQAKAAGMKISAEPKKSQVVDYLATAKVPAPAALKLGRKGK